MNYRNFGQTNLNTSILGLGTMRLPIIEGDNSKIDEPKAIELIRHAIDSGINYIDTAYPYHGKNSELIVGKALKDGYREKINLVTKSPVWLMKTYEDFSKYLDEQLEKLDTDCIDIYLLHALNNNTWQSIKNLDVFKFIKEAKASGKIKHIGFSMHDSYEVFEDIIDSHDWDMCMIQLNYIDKNYQAGVKGLKYAGSKNIPVAIMEPLKGGLLVNPPDEIQSIWNEQSSDRSSIEWSFKWLANFPEVKVILSGMNSIKQVDENIKITNSLIENSLSDFELSLYEKVKETYDSRIMVHCTKCQYCMPCPFGVDIPRNFALYNESYMYNCQKNASYKYLKMLSADRQASNCKACGACEPKCPQNIKIIDELKKVDSHLNKKQNFDSFHWNA